VSNKSTLYQPIQSQSYNPNITTTGPQSNTNIASNNYNNNNTNTLRGIQSIPAQHQQHHHSMMNESTINTVAPNSKIGSNNANYSTLRGVPQQQIQTMLQENVVSNTIPGTSYSNNSVNNANYNSIRTSVTSDNHLSINYNNNVNLRTGGGMNQQGPGAFQDNIGSNINSGVIQSNMSTNSANYTMRGVPQQSMNMMNNDSVVNNANNTIRTSVTQQQLATISQHDQLNSSSSSGNSNTGIITQANITSNNNSKSEWEQYFATSQSLNISGNIPFV